MQIKFSLQLESGNDAVVHSPVTEIRKILDKIKNDIGNNYLSMSIDGDTSFGSILKDSNGNTIGSYKFERS
jgi:hypothetical protein